MPPKAYVHPKQAPLFDMQESHRAPTVGPLSPRSDWRPPALSELPQDWSRYSRIGLDTETCDSKLSSLGCGARRGAFVVGYSFCGEGDRSWYVPMRHLGGDNVESPEKALEYVRHQAAHFQGEVVGANLNYDLDMLAEAGVVFHPNARFLDVQVAEPLLDELQDSYSLNSILERHGLPKKDETLLNEAAASFRLDPKKDLWKLPARYVGPYAERDAEGPLQLLRKQEEVIQREELERVWKLGIRMLPILLKMRRRGVRVDFEQLDRVERFSLAEESKAWGEVLRLTGVNIKVGDAMKAEVVAQAFRAVDIEPPRTPSKGTPSIDKFWLETIKHPVAAMVRRARKMSQLRTTFVASVRDHEIRGRIHATFNQARMEDESGQEVGVAFGRLSCCDPNMQQQPARDPEIGPMWRKVYLPDEGAKWASLDFSQQEPGLMLHYAVASGPQILGRVAYEAAVAAMEQKKRDPKVDYHTMFTAEAAAAGSFPGVTREMVLGYDKKDPALKVIRDPCKNIFLGVCYGSGGAKVCHTLGLPTEWVMSKKRGKMVEIAGTEGDRLLRNVDRGVPWLRKTAESVEKVARKRGYIKTLNGRRLHFEVDGNGDYMFTYRAMNRIVQGSAAEQTAESMIALDEMGCDLLLQVHDELDENVESREQAERHARVMEEAVQLLVPNRVDVEIGPSWGEAK